MEQLNEPLKLAGDATGLGVVLAAWFDYLPTVATILTVIWFALRIIETGQSMYYKHQLHQKMKTKELPDDKE